MHFLIYRGIGEEEQGRDSSNSLLFACLFVCVFASLFAVPCGVSSHVTSRTCSYMEGGGGRREGEIRALPRCVPPCLPVACLLAWLSICPRRKDRQANGIERGNGLEQEAYFYASCSHATAGMLEMRSPAFLRARRQVELRGRAGGEEGRRKWV